MQIEFSRLEVEKKERVRSEGKKEAKGCRFEKRSSLPGILLLERLGLEEGKRAATTTSCRDLGRGR